MWNDLDRWRDLCSGAACPICRQSEPLDVVAKIDASWVTMNEDAPVRGYASLVSQIHVVELHELPDLAALGFMRDAPRNADGEFAQIRDAFLSALRVG
jgi:diadenosine tetraphosphate (Ap4A) HIT family hydrolase